MAAYYNEHDPYAAAWLRNLIAAGLIAPGEVDDRDILDVRPPDLAGFTRHHFFAGIGGWSRALRLAGWPDDRPVWTGSCPCQPFSAAGKGKGVDDERHLWPAFKWLIQNCRPSIVFGEQVASRLGRDWLAGVRADLEGLGYGVGAADLCAAGVSAPHIRQRLFWVADADDRKCQRLTDGEGRQRDREAAGREHGDGIATACCEHRGLGNAIKSRLEGHARDVSDGREPGRVGADEGRSVAAAGRDCRMADADEGNAGIPGNPGAAEGSGREHRDDTGHRGAWGGAIWIPCADGKARRIEPGVKPLAHGLPRGVAPSIDPGEPGYAENTGEARRMRLSGYGNAIVPQLAAVFVKCSQQGEPNA